MIREQIVEDYGYDIGNYVSLEFNMSPGGRPVSVRVRGTDGWIDLKGDRFLRQTLGLKSTLVRALPFWACGGRLPAGPGGTRTAPATTPEGGWPWRSPPGCSASTP